MSADVGSGSESGVVIPRCGSLWADSVGNTVRAYFGDISVETPSRHAREGIRWGDAPVWSPGHISGLEIQMAGVVGAEITLKDKTKISKGFREGGQEGPALSPRGIPRHRGGK